MATPPAPFDPNAALRQFNQYFGTLQKQYGSAGLRNMGFTPRDLARMQADLRKLQLDRNATPEQHQQAYQQARDALAQRITTPQPVRALPQGEIVVAPTRPAPLPQPGPYYAEYLASLSAKPAPEQPPLAVMPERPMPTPMPTPTPPPPPPAPLHVDPQGPISVSPGGSANFNEATGVYINPLDPLSALKNFVPPAGATPPSTSGGIAGLLGATTPPATPSMNTQPGADFDRNVFSKMFNDQFAQLRQKYGDAGLRSAGFTPRTLAELQGGLRKMQMDPNSTYDQNSAALEAALSKMNSYNFGAPAQPVATPVAPPIPMIGDGPLRPTAEQEAAYRAALARGETGAWLPEGGTFLMNNAPMPQSMPQPVAAPTPMPQPVRTPLPNG